MSKNISLKSLVYSKEKLPNFYYCKMIVRVDEGTASFDLVTVADTMDNAVEEFRAIVRKNMINKYGLYVSNQDIAMRDMMSRSMKEIFVNYMNNKKVSEDREKNMLIDHIIQTRDAEMFEKNKKCFTKNEQKLINDQLTKNNGTKK